MMDIYSPNSKFVMYHLLVMRDHDFPSPTSQFD